MEEMLHVRDQADTRVHDYLLLLSRGRRIIYTQFIPSGSLKEKERELHAYKKKDHTIEKALESIVQLNKQNLHGTILQTLKHVIETEYSLERGSHGFQILSLNFRSLETS